LGVTNDTKPTPPRTKSVHEPSVVSVNDLALGIDLGGTNLRLGIVDTQGALIEFSASQIGRGLSGDEIATKIIEQASQFRMLPRVAGAGIALSASILSGGDVQLGTTPFAALVGYRLAAALSNGLSLPCLIDNDANLALLGEAHCGAARSFRDVLLLTLGTGIGGGLMLNRRLHHGTHSSAVEIGSTLVASPDYGGYSAVEELSSPGAIMRKLGCPGGLLFEQVEAGREGSRVLAERMNEHLGLLITNVHILLDLELVVLGGGLSASGEVLRQGVAAAFKRLCPPQLQYGLAIELGFLPPHAAGVIGAACLWFEKEGKLDRIAV